LAQKLRGVTKSAVPSRTAPTCVHGRLELAQASSLEPAEDDGTVTTARPELQERLNDQQTVEIE
jgi:hypothetical protein